MTLPPPPLAPPPASRPRPLQRTLSAASPAVVRFREVAQDCSYFYLVTEVRGAGLVAYGVGWASAMLRSGGAGEPPVSLRSPAESWTAWLLSFPCTLAPTPTPTQLCVSDLQRYLAEHPAPLHERQVACILRQLLTALAAVHRAGIAYRDVKPANLLVRGLDANGLPQLALADFGCCRSTAAAPPAARVSAGTPLFSAPECVHSAGGCEADLWSAGVLLYHLLSGRWPFCDPSVPISQVRAARCCEPLLPAACAASCVLALRAPASAAHHELMLTTGPACPPCLN